MQEKNKRLFDNILSQGALQVANYIIPLIVLPYQVRVVGIEKYGLIAFAASLIVYFTIIVEFGFNWSATKAISQNRHNNKNISHIFNSVMAVKTLLMLICFVILVAIVIFIPKFRQDWLVFMLSFLLLIGNNVIYPTWFFIGQERVRYITCLSILAKLIFMFSLFIFVKQEADYILIPLLNGIGAITAGVIGFVYAVRNFNLQLYVPRVPAVVKQFKDSTQFFLANVATSLYSNSNIFCLGLVSTNTVVGYYAAALKIYLAILGLRFPLDVSLYPYMAKNKDIKFFKKFVTVAFSMNTLVCLALIPLAGLLIHLVFGPNMLPSVRALQIFMIGAIIEFPSIISGYQLLVIFDHKKEANLSIYVVSAYHLIMLGLLLIFHKMSIYNLCMLSVSSTFLNFCIRMYYVNKYKLLKGK